jgi:hypothetical protein
MDAFRRSRPTTDLGRLAGEDSEPEGTLNVSLFLAGRERARADDGDRTARSASSTPRTTRLARARGGQLRFEAPAAAPTEQTRRAQHPQGSADTPASSARAIARRPSAAAVAPSFAIRMVSSSASARLIRPSSRAMPSATTRFAGLECSSEGGTWSALRVRRSSLGPDGTGSVEPRASRHRRSPWPGYMWR